MSGCLTLINGQNVPPSFILPWLRWWLGWEIVWSSLGWISHRSKLIQCQFILSYDHVSQPQDWQHCPQLLIASIHHSSIQHPTLHAWAQCVLQGFRIVVVLINFNSFNITTQIYFYICKIIFILLFMKNCLILFMDPPVVCQCTMCTILLSLVLLGSVAIHWHYCP